MPFMWLLSVCVWSLMAVRQVYEKERECLKLLLHSRILLSNLVAMRERKNELEVCVFGRFDVCFSVDID